MTVPMPSAVGSSLPSGGHRLQLRWGRTASAASPAASAASAGGSVRAGSVYRVLRVGQRRHHAGRRLDPRQRGFGLCELRQCAGHAAVRKLGPETAAICCAKIWPGWRVSDCGSDMPSPRTPQNRASSRAEPPARPHYPGFMDCLVRSRRLELPRAFAHNDLNVARLPVPPRPHIRKGRTGRPFR
jgi:hypothetical protein